MELMEDPGKKRINVERFIDKLNDLNDQGI